MTPPLPPRPPNCPHCGEALDQVNLYQWQCGAFVILSVACPNKGCEKMLHMMTLAVSEIPGAGVEPRVQIPS